MCGIIAYTGQRSALPILMTGLKRLEYRGYDSAGVALHHRKRLRCIKAAGKLSALQALLPDSLPSHCGIGHTRWATHGEPSDINAHPHLDGDARFALVHNGIIDNAAALRDSLIADGYTPVSETDSELLCLLLARHGGALQEALGDVLRSVRGTYGLAVLDRDTPGSIALARQGSPVIIGIGETEMLAASDMSAVSRYTRQVVHLDDGEIAILTPAGFDVFGLDARRGNSIEKTSMDLPDVEDDYDKGGYPHFLYREILDQPEVTARTLSGRLDMRFSTTHLGGLNLDARELLAIQRIRILGCGSALYAGMAGAHMIEQLARLPCDAEAAAEFRYRNPVIERDTLYIAVSQSGETFDTLAALREIKRKGGRVLGVVNTVGSTIAREVDGGVYMHAGPEVSVASTKAYTSMLTVFALLALMLGRLRDVSPQRGQRLVEAIERLPDAIRTVLALDAQIRTIAATLAPASSAFFIGRTTAYPIALEGAQKLKEISYIHAEAYPASELKHGPLALLTAETPCIVALPASDLLDKSIASLEEVKARKAPVIAISDAHSARIDELADQVIRLPETDALLHPILFGVALQLLAYHAAVALGRDIDQPRHLAKSVTVE